MWNFTTPGIPDELFERLEHVPITKEEVRTIQISKSRLRDGFIVYDIGCGTGSISVEASLRVGNSGKVFSIDYDENAVNLTKRNFSKFGISNATIIHGNAKEKILDLDDADVIIIGGTGNDTKQIIELSQKKLKSGGRIVIGIILIETLFSVLNTLENLPFTSIDITQVTISKSKKTTKGTMMLARNPVTIISASKI